MAKPIVVQASQFYPPSTGGIEKMVGKFAEAAADNEFDSRAITSVEQGLGTMESRNGVHVRRAGSLGVALSVPLAPSLPIRYRQTIANADIVHFHHPHPTGVVSELVAGKDTYSKLGTYHSDIVRQSTSYRLYRPLLDRFLDGLDRILVSSPQLKDESECLEPYKHKCEVVPNSIDPGIFSNYDGPRHDLPTENDRPTVLFVGRLIYYKGVEVLIDAMRDVAADLLIVGDGRRRAKLRKRIENRGVSGRVHMLGHVDDTVLRDVYDRADVFVLPSVAPSEAFGIVQLEAMANETPVINTDLPTGVPWVSIDGETGLTVDPGAADELADSINELLSNPELRREFGQNARARVENNFSDEIVTDKVLSIYRDLAEED
jgi:rhamnosyl/mannosyltransferase